jgi:hypothetical protein
MDKMGKIVIGVVLVALLGFGGFWVFAPPPVPTSGNEATSVIPGTTLYDKKTGKLFGYAGDAVPGGFVGPDGKRSPGILVQVAGSTAPPVVMNRLELDEKYISKME